MEVLPEPEDEEVARAADGDARTEDGALRQYFFPDLGILWLFNTCLCRREDFEAGRAGKWCEKVCCALRGRADGGLALVVLHLEGCSNVSKAAMAALEDAMDGQVYAGSLCASVRDTDDWET